MEAFAWFFFIQKKKDVYVQKLLTLYLAYRMGKLSFIAIDF